MPFLTPTSAQLQGTSPALLNVGIDSSDKPHAALEEGRAVGFYGQIDTGIRPQTCGIRQCHLSELLVPFASLFGTTKTNLKT